MIGYPKLAVRILWFPIRLLFTMSRTLLTLLFVAALALNIAMLTISGVYAAASAALSGVGIVTVAAREAGQKMAQRKATRKIGKQTAKKVTKRMQRSAARNIASIGGEAIPFVGAAVIAGGLAFEIKDACDTAADMAGLDAAINADHGIEAARQAAIDNFDCMAMLREQIPDLDSLPSFSSAFDRWFKDDAEVLLESDEIPEEPVQPEDSNTDGMFGRWFKSDVEDPT